MELSNPRDEQAEQRLAELIWRTIKLRASLLIILNIALLVIWSGVIAGDQRAKAIDAEFCSHLVALNDDEYRNALWNNGFIGPVQSLNTPVTCNQSPRTFLESSRMAYEQFAGSPDSPDPVAKRLRAIYVGKRQQFADYDSQRRDVYKLQFQLSSSYSSSVITVNALVVAEVAPFVALLLLAVVVILGFQQAQYKLEAAALMKKSKEPPISAAARMQFLVMPRPMGIRGWLAPSPEKMTVWGLMMASILSLLGVLSAFVSNVVHLTDSMFGNYSSDLFGFAWTLAILLVFSWEYYVRLDSVSVNRNLAPVRRWLERISIATAILALFLPWTLAFGSVQELRGYAFLLPQKPMLQAFRNVTEYPIDPHFFGQLRPQLYVAMIFIGASVLHLVARSRNWKWKRMFVTCRAFLALAVLYLSLNLLLYMGILEYEALTGISWDISTSLLRGITKAGFGLPLSFYDPSYGFALFLGSCLVLIVLSLRRYSDW